MAEKIIWKQRHEGKFGSVLEMLTATTGMSEQELVSPALTPAESIQNLPGAKELILACLAENRPVIIVGDYDADGITSTAILTLLFRKLGTEPRTIIPRRFTDGYGVSEKLVEGIRDSLLVCVDNGISAHSAIKRAKEAGNRILILDHHMPRQTEDGGGIVLPEADVIVDPHLDPEKNGYAHYCGAGLSLKLAELMIPDRTANRNLFYPITVLACMGTVADVVPLTGDNRRIVKDGLKLINSNRVFSMLTPGMQEILNKGKRPLNEEGIQFLFAPMLNAAGRLKDRGSEAVLNTLLCTDSVNASQKAAAMEKLNVQRKQQTYDWQRRYESILEDDAPVQILYLPGAPEGLMGLVASKLAEKTFSPTFVFTDAEEDGIMKGSGRTAGEYDLYPLLQEMLRYAERGGGHAGAAGLSVRKDRMSELKAAVGTFMENSGYSPEKVLCYDMEIDQEQMAECIAEQERYAPYGEGCPSLKLVIRGYRATAGNFNPAHYIYMGGEKTHLKLFGKGGDAVMFGGRSAFEELGCPACVDLLGTVSWNIYNGRKEPQFKVEAMRLPE